MHIFILLYNDNALYMLLQRVKSSITYNAYEKYELVYISHTAWEFYVMPKKMD